MTSSNLASHKISNYIITYPDTLQTEVYKNDSYDGIIFHVDEHKYDIVNNYHMGCRLIIKNEDGFKDIPFKPATFDFLPEGVKAEEIL